MDKGKTCKTCCKLKESIDTQKHKYNERIKRKEEQLSKMTEEEKDEYFMIKKMEEIWNKVRL